MILPAPLLPHYLYGSNKIMYVNVFWYVRTYYNKTLLYCIFFHSFFGILDLKKMKSYENKPEMLTLLMLSTEFWVQWQIKKCHISFLFPGSKLSKKNWSRLEDKEGIKCFTDIPYSVLHTGCAWKLIMKLCYFRMF